MYISATELIVIEPFSRRLLEIKFAVAGGIFAATNSCSGMRWIKFEGDLFAKPEKKKNSVPTSL